MTDLERKLAAMAIAATKLLAQMTELAVLRARVDELERPRKPVGKKKIRRKARRLVRAAKRARS